MVIPAVIGYSLCLCYDGEVQMAGGAQEVVRHPVLVVGLHLGVQNIVYEFREGGNLAVPGEVN